MIVIYVTTILMGTQSRGLFETSENGGIALAQISGHYLGRAGSLVLAVTITCACLKTAIGLVTSCSDAFSRMFPKGLSYRAWAVIFTVLSFLISNFGLSKIISYSLPLLLFPVSAGNYADSAGAVWGICSIMTGLSTSASRPSPASPPCSILPRRCPRI